MSQDSHAAVATVDLRAAQFAHAATYHFDVVCVQRRAIKLPRLRVGWRFDIEMLDGFKLTTWLEISAF